MARPLVILGSARGAGETRRAVDLAFPLGSIDLATLGDHKIGGYDYAHSNAHDDFLSIVDMILATDIIVFGKQGPGRSGHKPIEERRRHKAIGGLQPRFLFGLKPKAKGVGN